MTAMNRDDLKADNVITLPDNTAGVITPAVLRDQLSDLIDSAVFPEDGSMATITDPITLLAARTTDGSPGGVDWGGGPGLVTAYGTWGTATVQIAYSPDAGTTYINTDGALFDTNASMLLDYPPGKVRATIAGTTTGTSLSAKLESTR